mmetsp:Transcript_18668/g.39255  ORF Transcript_18668/g.39255 Transcript_18668/m.39255 type:complete len:745 (-) Transcript_18668:1189-3423(-)
MEESWWDSSDDESGKGRAVEGENDLWEEEETGNEKRVEDVIGNLRRRRMRFQSSGVSVPDRVEPRIEQDGEELPTEFGWSNGGERSGGSGSRESARTGMEPWNVSVIGDWERHTQGIGSRLLSKMGFSGGGLGANEQGMTISVEVKVRPERAGLGTLSNEIVEERREMEVKIKDTNRDQKRSPAPEARWRKKKQRAGGDGSRLQTESDGWSVDRKPDVVIDLRGASPVVIEDLAAAVRLPSGTRAKSWTMPELLHNMHLLYDRSQTEEEELSRKTAEAATTVEVLRGRISEIKSSKARIELEKKQWLSLRETLGKLKSAHTIGDVLDASDAMAPFVKDNTGGVEEQVSGALASAAGSILVSQINSISDLLDLELAKQVGLLRDILPAISFSRLLAKSLLPKLRAFLARWNPFLPDEIVSVIELWSPFLPGGVVEVIAHDLVIPRLLLAIDGWKPRIHPPIHAWLLVWLRLFGRKALRESLDRAKGCLGRAFVAWHPSDEQSFDLLQPWVRAIGAEELDPFFRRYIMPPLRDMYKRSAENETELATVLRWTTRWLPLMKESSAGDFLLDSFFPVWIAQLVEMLRSESLSKDRILSWYLLWRAIWPPEILQHLRIMAGISAGLDAINIWLDGLSLPTPEWILERRMAQLKTTLGGVHERTSHRPTYNVDRKISLRELVESRAQQAGLTLVPARLDSEKGGESIYKLGNTELILDERLQVVRVRKGKNDPFEPASLEDLIANAVRPL